MRGSCKLPSTGFKIAADTMAKRTNLRKYPEQKIVNADLILYYIAVLDKYNWAWFPILICLR